MQTVKLYQKSFLLDLEKLLALLISFQQTVYTANQHISESGRLISDLFDLTEKFKTKGYLVTIDTKKAFNSLDNSFLLTLEKIGFGINFTEWVKTF